MTEIKSNISETSSLDHPSGSTFDDTDDLELQQRLEKIEREIIEITDENTIFERALERKRSESGVHHVSSALRPISSSQTTTPTSSNQDLPNTSASNRSDRLVRRRSKSRSTQGDIRIQLTLEQKLYIVISEHEQMKIEKIRREKTNEKKIDELESDLEWIDLEIKDFETAITNFIKTNDSSIDKRTHKLIGEKLDHYFNERLKARGSLINKLHDRSSGLKRQIIRIEHELRQKEVADTLHEVDFNQLRIENKQYLDIIDEKNIELILLKRQTGKLTQLFKNCKNDLYLQTEDLFDIQQRIDKQQTLYEHIQQEIITANYEQSRAVKRHYHLVEQIENYQAPEILDYVRKKALLYKLQRDCEVWRRKVQIVSMALQQSKQQWLASQRTARYTKYADNRNN